MARDLDLVLFGATGFTGRRTAQLLQQRAEGLRWAVAGRDRVRLGELAERVGATEALPVDQLDADAVSKIVRRTRVVASTAGPFARLGDRVVDACAEHGVHYVDITGETPWARRVIDRNHARTRAAGTRLVPFCGFDSVPADLLCLALARAAHEEHGETLTEVTTIYRLTGGLNGGTLASALEIAEHEDPERLSDPWILVPEHPAGAPDKRYLDPRQPIREPGGERWVVPFFMGPINARVVMRSHALCGDYAPPGRDGVPRALGRDGAGYGAAFRYREFQRVSTGLFIDAKICSFLMGAGNRALSTGIGRALAERLGPKPGQGPDERDIEEGRTRARAFGRTSSGRSLEMALDAVGDPGNCVTTAILVEAARILCDPPAGLGLGEPGTGGVLTPALAFGELLLARLGNAGFRLSGPREAAGLSQG